MKVSVGAFGSTAVLATLALFSGTSADDSANSNSYGAIVGAAAVPVPLSPSNDDSSSSGLPSALKFEFSGMKTGKRRMLLAPSQNSSSTSKSRNPQAIYERSNKVSLDDPNFVGYGFVDAVTNNLTLTTSYNFYLTNVTFGEPGQELELGFDTGSPYLWVYGPNGSYGDAPMYYPSKSQTYHSTNKSFSGFYGAGGVFGNWATDNLTIANGTLSQFPFGVIESFQISAGVPGLIGLGPNYQNLTSRSYSNVPEALYRQNVTSSPAFSVYLDDKSGGGVIFGGIDNSRYDGPIYEYDIAQTGSTPTYYYQLHINSLALNGNQYDVFNVVILDTGSPFCQLPQGFVDQVGQSLNLTYNSKYRAYYAPNGTDINANGTISFQLGHLTLDIPIAEFIVPGEYIWVDDGPQKVKALGLMGAPQYVLGDGFFRGAYAVLDSMHKKIYLAKSAHVGNTSTNITADIQDLPVVGVPGALPGPISVDTSMPSSLLQPSTSAVLGTAPLEYTSPMSTPVAIATSSNPAPAPSSVAASSGPVTTLEVTVTQYKTIA